MSDVRDMGSEAASTAKDVTERRWVQRLARVGYAASGVLHILIGWIAARVALGGSGDADQTGALASLRENPAGAVLLWVVFVGFTALALWYLVTAVVGADGAKDRVRAASTGAVYAVLAGTTFIIASGGQTDSEESTNDVTTVLMGMPAGRMLVAVVGVVVVGVGVYHVYKGLSQKFLEDLRITGGGAVGRGVTVAGMVGYPAKGVALAIVGVLFIVAAWQADPDEAGGLDAALKTLVGQPFGVVLLVVVAIGLVLYGLYSLARARYARMG